MVLFPYYIKTLGAEGKGSTEELLTKWLNAYIFIAIGMILLSFSLRNELIMLLANNKYSEGANLIPILLTGLLVNGCYYFISASFFLQKQTTKLGIILIASSVLNIIIVFFLGAWKDMAGLQ
jgi:O-antigen/teichoic acid export membrane protein